MTTPLAVNQWYGHSKMYDHKKGTTIYPKGATSKPQVDLEADFYKGLLWRAYGKASFAVHAPWVVGRFCGSAVGAIAPAKRTAIDNVQNVNPVCTLAVGTTDGGYNICYNKMALRYHNEQRSLREGTKNLKFDPAIAKYIQAEMEKTTFSSTGKITKGGQWTECGESLYM
jgi:hypothetical protein